MVDNGSESFKLAPEDVKEWKKFSGTDSGIQLDQETDRFLKSIFGEFLDLFYKQEAKTGNENYRHLANNFLKLVLDQGLNREITLFGESLHPVMMIGRMGGISWLKEKINFKEQVDGDKVDYQVDDENFRILTLDVSNVFGANQVENGKGGDYLLNKVASAINNVVDDLRKELGEGVEILPVRYGGDEFAVFVKGQLTQEQINKISTEINNQRAFFGREPKEEKIFLKGDKIQIIDLREISDPSKKKLFYSFLNRGVILSPDELEKEYQKISQREGGIESYINEAAARDIYPKNIEEMPDEIQRIETKIKYLTEIHPELKVPFYLAWYLDKKDKPSSINRQQEMLKVVENYLVDPLLNRIVISRFDLEDHIKRNEIKKILAFELKLKETNEDKDLGYGYTDLLIVETWRQLKQVLGDELINKLKIMRFGGTIGLCFSEGVNITQEQVDKLKNLQISLGGVTHDVGFAHINLEDNSLSIEQKIQQIFTQSDFDWLRKRVNFVLSNDQIYNLFIDKLTERKTNAEKEELENKDDKEKQLQLFLSYLLNEKRGETRRENLKRVLEDLKKETKDEKINRILNNLN